MEKTLAGFEQVNRYWDRRSNVVAAKILPGEYYVTRSDEMITTVLGSCVAACIRDRVFGIGGMNHFMLPIHDDPSSFAGNSNRILSSATRYGNYAMEHLINTILTNGGHRKNLEVKVFGGGRIISELTDVGRKNIEFVCSYLETEGFQVTAKDLGGDSPRKVVYYPKSGRVLMKKLRSLHNDTIVQRERRYLHEIDEQPVVGEIELFT
ncbi:MAG: chemoreceptor glutamine deamidase CheD [Chromatiales bacterium]|nr:chemoreceptor glutamine deamidase CheD [Chromatiales bacterium]